MNNYIEIIHLFMDWVADDDLFQPFGTTESIKESVLSSAYFNGLTGDKLELLKDAIKDWEL